MVRLNSTPARVVAKRDVLLLAAMDQRNIAKNKQKVKYYPPKTYDPWWFTEEGLADYQRIREVCERIKTQGY